MTLPAAITNDDLDRIASAEHPDPHSVLGPHTSASGILVRAFRPEALEIRVLPDERIGMPPRRMRRVHDLGIFEARFPEPPSTFAYRLEVQYAAEAYTLRDPYAFPPTLGELDVHLAAEGTHEAIYRYLGAHVRTCSGVSGVS